MRPLGSAVWSWGCEQVLLCCLREQGSLIPLSLWILTKSRRCRGQFSVFGGLALSSHSQKYELFIMAFPMLEVLPVASISFLWGTVLWDLQEAEYSQ